MNISEYCMKPENMERDVEQDWMEYIQQEITSLSLYALVHISFAHLDIEIPSSFFFAKLLRLYRHHLSACKQKQTRIYRRETYSTQYREGWPVKKTTWTTDH